MRAPGSSNTSAGSTAASTAVLVAIVLVAAGLRWERLFEGLWLDELHTSWTISGSLGEMRERAAIANVSPAWFVLPRWSTQLAGPSEVTLRAPSFLAGLAVLVALYGLVWRWTGSQVAALLAAFLAAADRHFIFYAADERAYATLQLVGIAQVACFVRLVFPGRPDLQRSDARLAGVAVLLSALLFYLHYSTALLLIAEAIFAVRRPSRTIVLSGLATAVLCLGAVPQLMEIAARGGEFARAAQPRDVGSVLSQLVLERSALLCAGLAVLAWATARSMRGAHWVSAVDGERVAWCVVWFAVPLVLAWLLTMLEVAPLREPRYVIVSAAAPIVLAALFCGALVDVRARLALGVALAGTAVAVGAEPSSVSEGWREAIARISEDAKDRGLPVFVRSGLLETNDLTDRDAAENTLLYQYALLPATGLYPIEPPGRDLSPLRAADAAKLRPAQRELVVERGGAWLLLRGTVSGARSVAERIREDFEAHGHPAGFSLGEAHGTVHLFRLELRANG